MTPLEAKILISFALAPNYGRSSSYCKEVFNKQAEELIYGIKKLPLSYPIIPERFIKKILEKYKTMNMENGYIELNKMLKEEQRSVIGI